MKSCKRFLKYYNILKNNTFFIFDTTVKPLDGTILDAYY